MRVFSLALAAATLSLFGTAAGPETAHAPPTRPTLVVLIAVDQLRADYLTRYEQQFTGGLARLIRDGTWYVNGFQDHANTETAPGHSEMLSGRFPSHNGIVSNERGVPDTSVRLIGSSGPGASPARFRGDELFDWIRAREPAARALSVSRKDRAAILPVGHAREHVYWFAPEGLFTTSTYYADTLPAWVRAFNAHHHPSDFVGTRWTLLLPDSAYAEPDSQPIEAGGRGFTFPHAFPVDSMRAAAAIQYYPWMDDLTLDFALDGVEALGLGRGAATDLLSVSLSTTDAIGHRYGPDSREIHDQVLRLDRGLGRFIDSLYRLRDSARIVFALTSDHGVAPFPELYAARTGQPAGHVSLRAILTATREALTRRGVPRSAFRIESAALWVDRAAFAAARVPLDSVVRAFADSVRHVPGVLRVDAVRDLGSADTVHDTLARRWYHAIPADLPIELVITLRPYFVWGQEADAQHGGPHDYDARVPILFYGPPFRTGRHEESVRVVDIAPTLAAALGVQPAARLDGQVLRAALR